jgi:hypothetical protein
MVLSGFCEVRAVSRWASLKSTDPRWLLEARFHGAIRRMVGAQEIEDALIRFDGRRVAALRLLVERGIAPDGVAALIAALPGPREVGASWMLKALGEIGALSRIDLERVFASLPDLTETDAILHVLQMVCLDPEAAQGVRNAMVPLAGHRNLLVTVWTFDAYCRTASGPGAAADREERIRQGLTNRSKAMRARARALAREFGVDP